MLKPENTRFAPEVLEFINESTDNLGIDLSRIIGSKFLFFSKDKYAASNVFGGTIKGFDIQLEDARKPYAKDTSFGINLVFEGIPKYIIRRNKGSGHCGVAEITGWYSPEHHETSWIAYPDNEDLGFISIQGTMLFLD